MHYDQDYKYHGDDGGQGLHDYPFLYGSSSELDSVFQPAGLWQLWPHVTGHIRTHRTSWLRHLTGLCCADRPYGQMSTPQRIPTWQSELR